MLKPNWYSLTELGEKLSGICVHYDEKLLLEITNRVEQNNNSICEISQTDSKKITIHMLENIDGAVAYHKPIPVIEKDIENTVIEPTVVESRELD